MQNDLKVHSFERIVNVFGNDDLMLYMGTKYDQHRAAFHI